MTHDILVKNNVSYLFCGDKETGGVIVYCKPGREWWIPGEWSLFKTFEGS